MILALICSQAACGAIRAEAAEAAQLAAGQILEAERTAETLRGEAAANHSRVEYALQAR